MRLFGILIVIVSFIGCTGVSTDRSYNSRYQERSGTGNGGGYDGMVYYLMVKDYTCNDSNNNEISTYANSIKFENKKAYDMGNQCEYKKTPLDNLNFVDSDFFGDQLIGVKGKAYQTEQNLIYGDVLIWCSTIDTKGQEGHLELLGWWVPMGFTLNIYEYRKTNTSSTQVPVVQENTEDEYRFNYAFAIDKFPSPSFGLSIERSLSGSSFTGKLTLARKGFDEEPMNCYINDAWYK